jgi:hypothetical protein
VHQASLQDVMEHLNDKMMNKSINLFPFHRQLMVGNISNVFCFLPNQFWVVLQAKEQLVNPNEIANSLSSQIYDPAFMLPLCHQLLGEGGFEDSVCELLFLVL